jgi:Ca2+-binding RTX toxin-like protein
MAINAISADTSTTIVANTSGDIWIVKEFVEVTTVGDAINGTGSNGGKTFLIHGHLIAEDDGIDLGDSVLNNGGGNRVHIQSTGSIFAESSAIESAGGGLDLTNEGSLFSSNTTIFAEDGNNAIANLGTITSSSSAGIVAFGGNNTIGNGGAISARGTGIVASGGSSEVTNTGTITSSGHGIFADSGNNTIGNGGTITAAVDGIFANGSGNLIVNSGAVVSSSTSAFDGAVEIFSQAGGSNRLVNSGELSSQLNAVLGGDGNETVVNRGAINGDVDLGAGSDFFRNAGQLWGNVDLGAGNDLFKGWGGTVDGTIHGRGRNDTLNGGAADDAIFGDNGNDVLRGADGDDTLTGGAGRDIMAGGAGADSFDFNKTNESAVGTQRDRIGDFSQGEDVIDVAGIDAKSGVGGNQAFTFIANAAFSGSAGELRATATASGNTIIAGDTDGDASADFQILVQGVTGLTAGDFLL